MRKLEDNETRTSVHMWCSNRVHGSCSVALVCTCGVGSYSVALVCTRSVAIEW